MEYDLGRTPVVLLAGGKSSRMGQPKGLVAFQGRPWLETQLSRLAGLGVRETIIVLGYQAELYIPTLSKLQMKDVHIQSVLNPLPEFGPFTSVQAGGKRALQMPICAAWILPIDVPCPSREVWQRLSASSATVCVPTHGARGGHPVRISKEFLIHLLEVPADGPDSRLDRQIRLAGQAVEYVEVADPSVLKNLNSLSDWQ